MVKQMSSIDELFNYIESSKLYNDYINVREKLKNNEEIMNLIKEIKRYQKIATNNKDSSVEMKLKELYSKLNSYPLYNSYLLIKEELEEKMLMIRDVFDKYFYDLLKIDDQTDITVFF